MSSGSGRSCSWWPEPDALRLQMLDYLLAVGGEPWILIHGGSVCASEPHRYIAEAALDARE